MASAEQFTPMALAMEQMRSAIDESAAVAQPVERAPCKRQVVGSKPTSGSKKLTARSLVADIKARLRVVEREIKTRHRLETERDQLKRLLEAASRKPAPVVGLRNAG